MTMAALVALLPMVVIVATGILLLLFEVFAAQRDRTFCANIAVAGSAIALFFAFGAIDEPPHALFAPASGGPAPIIIDAFATFASIVIIAGGLIAALLSPSYVKNAECYHGEYYALILFSVAGAMGMVGSGDLAYFFPRFDALSMAVS